MAARLKIVVAYDGAPFAGWQSQSHRNTIQDHLEGAFSRIFDAPLRVHGAGRTDAGVHALGQCAHIDLPDRRFSPDAVTRAVNALLPAAIRVWRSRYTNENFHARYSAKGKQYRYRLWAAEILPPFEFQRAWHVPRPLDYQRLRSAAQRFVGTHDFAGFAANRGKPETSTVRTIRSVRVGKKGALITVDFDGEGFLYKMVRLMIGAAVQCAEGKTSGAEISRSLASASVIRGRHTAPPEGLFLLRIRY